MDIKSIEIVSGLRIFLKALNYKVESLQPLEIY